jgi:hypothetical protein
MQVVDGDAAANIADMTKSVTADRRFRIDVTPAWKRNPRSSGRQRM